MSSRCRRAIARRIPNNESGGACLINPNTPYVGFGRALKGNHLASRLHHYPAGRDLKSRGAEDAQSPAGKPGRDAAYDYVTKSLHARGRLNDAQRIKQSWDRQDKLRTGLADPVKDSSGRPAIPALMASTCTLS